MPTTFEPLANASTFRRIAAAMWRQPSDPSIYGSMDLDVTGTLRFMERYRQQTGRRLTVTHVVARAVAQAFARFPDLNAKVRFGGRLERRRTVDLFVSVATDGGKDLSGARVEDAADKDLGDIITELESRALDIRKGKDRNYEKSRGTFRTLPWWLARPLMWLTDVLTNELHLHLPTWGLPRDPFGTAVITNVGPFGIDTAFAPFLPIARCPMLLLVTEVKPRAWVAGGRLEVRPVLRLCATFDHRIIDGFSAGRIASVVRDYVENPGMLLDQEDVPVTQRQTARAQA
ncbi:MAG: 2-oxo acid dehydrogenase subunit E2 [Deltaproteobacteria bacterium]|nr:2-oxo acid dehydrogenase subunit E2 [Deltaproteobacteria bacterium]